ncbi:ParB/RepB/Spo0J family partition protein [Maritimibacter alkaliphilus]|uniref:ParB/RepB/Spo0J family partition protein n=1 Tax=Maritimibacter alkaliphilus TaxID=404236 RepID=UPI001C953B5E|nr:ParB/RepB/Spo0J family partition protein [Maritimibacter alkaliphilus]MBY6092376.1 ParB/RepB/Spo0J family partition protein [Maritimibacter alkaliphilus]
MTAEKQELTIFKRQKVKLAEIHTRPEIFQYREMEYDTHHVEELKDTILSKGALDRIDLWRDPETAELVVLDGHHRVRAYARAGKPSAPAIIYEGPEEAARLHALKENSKARLQMTPTEKSNAAWRLVCLVKTSGGYLYSKQMVARHTGASERTVATMRSTRRKLLEADQDLPDAWWAALAALKDHEGKELTEDDREAVIEERTRRLDEKVGKEIAVMSEIQPEAVMRMLERRLGWKLRQWADYWRSEDDPFGLDELDDVENLEF